MALRRRKHAEEEHESHERWLVSYADFITLLFAFFVVMYAVSSVNQTKYREVGYALGSAFGNRVPFNGQALQQVPSTPLSGERLNILPPLPMDQLRNERFRKEQERITAMAQDLANALATFIDIGKLRVIQTNYGIRIDISDSLLFAPGSAELAEAAKAPLMKIAEILSPDSHAVQVEGHTDNIPIHNASFYSNWELSAVRASTVVRLLADNGIQEERLSATGFGSAQPVADNSMEHGRANNRRVSVMLLYRGAHQSDTDLAEIRPAQDQR